MGVKKITHPNGTNTPDEIVVEYAIKDNAGNVIKDTYAKSSDLSQVATSGSYADLSNKPTIPTNMDYVDKTTNQTISGQKDFNTIPRVKVEHQSHNLPEEFQEVYYIESSGTQWIDTTFSANQNTRVVLDYQEANIIIATHSIIGARDSSTAGYLIGGRATYYWYAQYGNSQTPNTIFLNDTNRHKVDLNKNLVYFDNSLVYTFSTQTFSIVKPLRLFICNDYASTNNSYTRIYSCEIYDNGLLVRNFIPCYRKSDNEPGMYDLVNNVFYTNSGTGDFEVGPIVETLTYKSLLTDASFAAVAKTGNYSDLVNKPTIPANTSDLTNDNGFITNTTAHITESQVVNLTNDLTNIREVAEGKSKAIPISLSLNSAFDSQQDTLTASSITDLDGNVIQSNNLKVGDNIYISELNVPDRWYSGNNQFSKLETQKVILPTFTPAFNEGTELLSISDGTKVYVPNAGKFSWTDGMVGVVNKSISQLEPGQYSAATTYQGSVVPKATKMSGGEFWNSSSGAPMDISFYFNTPVAPTMIVLGIGNGYGVPNCAIYYYNDNDEETFLQNITLAMGEVVNVKINQDHISSNKWIIRLTPDSWVSVKCVDFTEYQIGIVGPDIINDIADKASVPWIQQQHYLQYITCNNTKATKTGSTIKIEDIFKLVSGYGSAKQYLTNKNGSFVWEEPISITKTSELVNDSDFITSAALDDYTTLNTDQTIEGKKTFTNIPEVALTRTIVPEGSSLPEEYQEVEYLQSTGTQYIDLQYFPVSSDTITIKLAPQEPGVDKAFFGCYGGGFTCELGQMGAGYYRGNVGATSEAAKFAVDETHELVMYNGVWHKGNIAFGITNSGTSSIPAYIFGRNYGGANKLSQVKLFSLKVHRSDELYRNFIPCYRIADNVPGLYETVTGEFHTSVTNNNFVLGADVEREDQSYDVTETFTLPVLERIQGYDITKTQTLKNVFGTFMWVND